MRTFVFHEVTEDPLVFVDHLQGRLAAKTSCIIVIFCVAHSGGVPGVNFFVAISAQPDGLGLGDASFICQVFGNDVVLLHFLGVNAVFTNLTRLASHPITSAVSALVVVPC